MDKEKLIAKIMRECDEPITREDAEMMAEMELRDKANRRYEQAGEPRKKADRVRKVDEEKGYLLTQIKTLLDGILRVEKDSGEWVPAEMKNETELDFTYGGNAYTLKLIKHRPKK